MASNVDGKPTSQVNIYLKISDIGN